MNNLRPAVEPLGNADQLKKEIYDSILQIWTVMKSLGFERKLTDEEFNTLINSHDATLGLSDTRSGIFYRSMFQAMADYYEGCYKAAVEAEADKEDAV